MKKQLILTLMIFFITGLGLHFSSDVSSDQSNSFMYKGVLNEQLDEHILMKIDDKKHFFVVPSLTVIVFILAITNSPVIFTTNLPAFQIRFFTAVFFQSNYLDKSPSLNL